MALWLGSFAHNHAVKNFLAPCESDGLENAHLQIPFIWPGGRRSRACPSKRKNASLLHRQLTTSFVELLQTLWHASRSSLSAIMGSKAAHLCGSSTQNRFRGLIAPICEHRTWRNAFKAGFTGAIGVTQCSTRRSSRKTASSGSVSFNGPNDRPGHSH